MPHCKTSLYNMLQSSLEGAGAGKLSAIKLSLRISARQVVQVEMSSSPVVWWRVTSSAKTAQCGINVHCQQNQWHCTRAKQQHLGKCVPGNKALSRSCSAHFGQGQMAAWHSALGTDPTNIQSTQQEIRKQQESSEKKMGINCMETGMLGFK